MCSWLCSLQWTSPAAAFRRHCDLPLSRRGSLADVGMRTERPPEEWLYKAWCDDVLIDVIFGPSGLEVDDAVLGRADAISVMAVTTPVMALEDVLVTMICALDEHTLDYSQLIA